MREGDTLRNWFWKDNCCNSLEEWQSQTPSLPGYFVLAAVDNLFLLSLWEAQYSSAHL